MATNLIVYGLGNPGPDYRDTRHNLGFWVADLLSERFRGRWRQPSDRHLQSQITVAGRSVLLVEPLTYMNLSGEVLRLVSGGTSLDPSDLLVVCDDIALPLGRVRLRGHGSHGGHNGLRSVVETLGTTTFPRLRLGVGPVPEGVDPADFVLSPFTAAELAAAGTMVERASDCVEAWVVDGVDAAMNRFNVRSDAGDSPGEETD